MMTRLFCTNTIFRAGWVLFRVFIQRASSGTAFRISILPDRAWDLPIARSCPSPARWRAVLSFYLTLILQQRYTSSVLYIPVETTQYSFQPSGPAASSQSHPLAPLSVHCDSSRDAARTDGSTLQPAQFCRGLSCKCPERADCSPSCGSLVASFSRLHWRVEVAIPLPSCGEYPASQVVSCWPRTTPQERQAGGAGCARCALVGVKKKVLSRGLEPRTCPRYYASQHRLNMLCPPSPRPLFASATCW